MIATTETQTVEYTSTGMVCQLCQRAPHAIRKASEELGIRPVMILNGIAHFSGPQVDALVAHFAAKTPKGAA